MKKLNFTLVIMICLSACATVDITKTGKGYFSPTNPNEIEIFKTRPDKPFEELGIVTAIRFRALNTAKMHNAIRVKAAQLGASAVILTEEGLSAFGDQRWANGVAIRYK